MTNAARGSLSVIENAYFPAGRELNTFPPLVRDSLPFAATVPLTVPATAPEPTMLACTSPLPEVASYGLEVGVDGVPDASVVNVECARVGWLLSTAVYVEFGLKVTGPISRVLVQPK